MFRVGEEVTVKIDNEEYDGIILKELKPDTDDKKKFVVQLYDDEQKHELAYANYPIIITTEDRLSELNGGCSIMTCDYGHKFHVDDVVRHNNEIGYIISSCGYHNNKEGYVVEVLNAGKPKRVIWSCGEMDILSDDNLLAYFDILIKSRMWTHEEDDSEVISYF